QPEGCTPNERAPSPGLAAQGRCGRILPVPPSSSPKLPAHTPISKISSRQRASGRGRSAVLEGAYLAGTTRDAPNSLPLSARDERGEGFLYSLRLASGL